MAGAIKGGSHDAVYIVASDDRTIPPAGARDSAKRMNATTLALVTSHVPMLSEPEKVAGLVMEAVATLNAK